MLFQRLEWSGEITMVMKKPEMIIFDYGHTLLCEPDFDAMRCEAAAYPYIVENPQNLTVEQIYAEVQRMFAEFQEQRNSGIEIHEWQFMRLVYEYLGLKFSISYSELEEIEWNAASPGDVMPGVGEMLDYLNYAGIRTAVISNIGWSGSALANRIKRLLPNNKFEFIMASSEYLIRKPNRMLFETALRKANLPADAVWYCGDNIVADVKGAHGAGIYPVLYEGTTTGEMNSFTYQNEGEEVEFDYLHIHEWSELTALLKSLVE